MSNNARARRWTGWTARKPSVLRPFPACGFGHGFEQLEDRLAPATFTWTGLSSGAGASANWSNPGNWLDQNNNQAVPNGAVIDLVFPNYTSGNHRLANTDDLAGGTVINSITVQGAGYNLTPKAAGTNTLTLGTGAPSSGTFTVQAGVGGVTYGIQTTLATNGDQSINVGTGSTLSVTAALSGSLQNNLNKDGTGRLELGAANPNLLGGVKVNSGILQIDTVTSLGPAGGTETVVSTNAAVYLDNIAAVGAQTTIGEQIRLNGGGFDINKGALYAESGNAVWSGPVILDQGIVSPPQAGGPGVVIGAGTGFQLNITGVISDTGSGMGLVKEGAGEVVLGSATGNTYRGQTNINNGILTATNALSLGDSRPTTVLNPSQAGTPNQRPLPGNFNSDPNSAAFQNPLAGTVINDSPGKAGQLRLKAPSGSPGFTIVGEYLVLNGAGLDGNGAIYNTVGDNTWAGSVILGSSAPDGVAPTIGVAAATPAVPPSTPAVPSSLDISGVISDPNLPNAQLTKFGGGRLILTNANTYRGITSIAQGTVTVRDSQALGPAGAASGIGTTVSVGAALELDVEAAYDTSVVPRYDDLGRDTWADSITNDAQKLQVNERLTISGRGVGSTATGTGVTSALSTGGTGALRSVTGINQWVAPIQLSGSEAAIGVEPDGPVPGVNNVTTSRAGHPTPDGSYFTADYSLTVLGTISGGRTTDFAKRGAGDLILPNANPYLGRTLIEQGWVTAENNTALGGTDPTFGPTAQQPTVVSNGAALMLRPPVPGVALNLQEANLVLQGIGPSNPYTLISQKGALVSLGGANIVSSDIGVINTNVGTQVSPLPPQGAGIGVENVVPDPSAPATDTLTLTGDVSDGIT
ncbi:MAG TPA: autotransporter-associated beta strand repeat-containing protein, partial [Urbifossiella sp.]|nr:autotransporter-associated beta strand repeat-containing protein [Urbifossiella sp.]